LDINEDTAIAFTTNNFLLVASHFKSSAPSFDDQEKELLKVLDFVIEYYSSKKIKIIVGMDANHYIKEPKLKQKSFICPDTADKHTSIKKRSYIQAQMHKADQQVD
jgi:hypothetical protein